MATQSWLEYWIKQRQMTRKEVAKKAKLSYGQLSRYVRREAEFWPNTRATRGVLRALDINFDQLIKGPGKIIELTPGGVTRPQP
jgi:transcriptional regulator with XRE-family HTH domain